MVTANCGSGTGSRKGLVEGSKVEALHEYGFVSLARKKAGALCVLFRDLCAITFFARFRGGQSMSERPNPQYEDERVDPR